MRVKDRTAKWKMTKEFFEFIDQCLESRPKEPSSMSQEQVENSLADALNNDDEDENGAENEGESVKEQAELLFLGLF